VGFYPVIYSVFLGKILRYWVSRSRGQASIHWAIWISRVFYSVQAGYLRCFTQWNLGIGYHFTLSNHCKFRPPSHTRALHPLRPLRPLPTLFPFTPFVALEHKKYIHLFNAQFRLVSDESTVEGGVYKSSRGKKWKLADNLKQNYDYPAGQQRVNCVWKGVQTAAWKEMEGTLKYGGGVGFWKFEGTVGGCCELCEDVV
jgi:hypothetical protein